MDRNKEYDLYKNIKERCGGEIYIGVVGPVRTGKSTFIKRFMENLVLPNIENDFERWNGKTVDAFVTNYMNKPNDPSQMSLICSTKEYLKFLTLKILTKKLEESSRV